MMHKQHLMANNSRVIDVVLSLLFSALGTVGFSFYLETPFTSGNSSSIFLYLLFAVLFFCWHVYFYSALPVLKQEHGVDGNKVSFAVLILGNLIFSFLFSAVTVAGKYVDKNIYPPKISIFTSIAMTAAVFPISMLIHYALARKIDQADSSTAVCQRHAPSLFQVKCLFAIICISWFCVYLAAFPGIYSSDAYTWYREFQDTSMPVSSQWSVIDAGLFYLFVHTGYAVTGNYESGFAVFTLIQMIFALAVVWRILKYISLYGTLAAFLTMLFYAIIPLHAIIAVQSIQAAPFMACFGMFMLQIFRLTQEGDRYWNRRKNVFSLIIWGVLCGLFRNNALIAFIVFLFFIPLYRKTYRKKLFFAMSAIICSLLLYSGPILNLFHVQKGTSLREMLSLPVQQMACAYCLSSEYIKTEDLTQLEQYISRDSLLGYKNDPAISDNRKNNLNLDLVRSDPGKFAKLYIRIGLQAPLYYAGSLLLQDLGLVYVDKSYPDWRTWHPYIDYGSYVFEGSEYITIERKSLFPAYDRLLRKMFGYSVDGYGGDKETIFSSIPLYGIILRVATYFWILFWLALFCIIRRDWKNLPVHMIIWGYMLTILLAPVILYRYCAPIMFVFPLVVLTIFNNKNRAVM